MIIEVGLNVMCIQITSDVQPLRARLLLELQLALLLSNTIGEHFKKRRRFYFTRLSRKSLTLTLWNTAALYRVLALRDVQVFEVSRPNLLAKS